MTSVAKLVNLADEYNISMCFIYFLKINFILFYYLAVSGFGHGRWDLLSSLQSVGS